MTRYLMVTWDGAGNLVSTLGIARTLVAEGHDVRMIGHASIEERCGDQGARFIPFTPEADWDPLQVPANFEEEMAMIRERLCFNPAIANDVLTELEREPADVLVVDCMLFTALSAAEASGSPDGDARAHALHDLPRGAARRDVRRRPRSAQQAPCRPRTGAGRPARRAARRQRAGDRRAAEGVRAGVPGRAERVPDGTGAGRAGAPAHRRGRRPRATRRRPLVLVSLSTAEQGQVELLQSIADAVAGLPGPRDHDDRTGCRSGRDRGRPEHPGRAVPAAQRDPAGGVTRDHPRGARHGDGVARPRRAAGVRSDGSRPVLQRRAGRGAGRRPDASSRRGLRGDRRRGVDGARRRALPRRGRAVRRHDQTLWRSRGRCEPSSRRSPTRPAPSWPAPRPPAC